ncbi:MAG: GntR family transcriptional regulator [Bacilli bacterium]
MNIILSSKIPIFEQIVQKIKMYIDSSVLKEDEKLPSVRELAISLSINPNTVAKAYGLLEEEKYIYSLPKKGYFVCKKNDDDLLSKAKERFENALDEALEVLSINDVIEIIQKRKGDTK